MSTTTQDDRTTVYSPVLATTEFAADFPVFSNEDITVYIDGEERTDFTVTATYVEGISTDAKAVFDLPGVTGAVVVLGMRPPRRTNRFTNGGPLPIKDLNLALDTVEAENQEARRDIDRSHKAPFGQAGGVFNASDIGNAQANAAAAAASAGAASSSAAAAAASAASINLPAIGVGNKGKGLTINPGETGYELNLLSIVVATRTALKALTTAITRPVYLSESGREGFFLLRSGTVPVTDTQEGVYVVSNTAGFYWERVVGDFLNVLWFGAVGDDTTQCAPAFNGAVAVAKFFGKRIFAPAGTYKFNAAVTIDAGVVIEGEGWQPYKLYPGGTTPSTRGGGTWFHITHTSAPLFDVVRPSGGRCSGVFLNNFGMFQDHPVPGAGWAPTVYPYCIRGTSVDDLICENLYFHGCYQGIQLTGTLALPAGRLRCRQILGQCFAMGIDIDLSLDVSVLENIHFWLFWSDNTNVRKWMRTNGTTIRSARNDNPLLSNIFSYGHRTGLLMTGNAYGVTSGLLANHMTFDDCPRGFHFAPAGAAGWANFSDCYVTANPVAYGGGEPNADLMVVEGINYNLRFNGVRLTNSQGNSVIVLAAGCDLRFVNCWFDQWNILASGYAAIHVVAGSAARLYNGLNTQSNGGAASSGAGTVTYV